MFGLCYMSKLCVTASVCLQDHALNLIDFANFPLEWYRWDFNLLGKHYTQLYGLLLFHFSWSCWVSLHKSGSLLEVLGQFWLLLLAERWNLSRNLITSFFSLLMKKYFIKTEFWPFQILTNFLSSVMIHATRPFVLNEWIQTKIEGYEVSGTVEVSIIIFELRYFLASMHVIPMREHVLKISQLTFSNGCCNAFTACWLVVTNDNKRWRSRGNSHPKS